MNTENRPKTLADIRKAIGKAKAADQGNLRDLSAAESKTAEKLKTMIAALKAGKNVQNRQIKTWLTPNQYQTMLDNWEDQKSLRLNCKDKPQQIQKYQDLLRIAIFTYNKAEGFSTRGNHQAASKLFNQADGEFERALEHLSEIINIDPSLQTWFDRPISFGEKSTLGIDFDSMPRVIVSQSHFAQSTKMSVITVQRKMDVKVEVLENALQDLLFETPATDVSNSLKLAELLKSQDPLDDDYQQSPSACHNYLQHRI